MAKERCKTCLGRKKVYSIGGNSFTLCDTGGTAVKCPECSGSGFAQESVKEHKKRD